MTTKKLDMQEVKRLTRAAETAEGNGAVSEAVEAGICSSLLHPFIFLDDLPSEHFSHIPSVTQCVYEEQSRRAHISARMTEDDNCCVVGLRRSNTDLPRGTHTHTHTAS